MPLSRYCMRNEYCLAAPELHRAADKDDPEALLEGVTMAGLVGVLRQLGDLAQFAAEIFHDLHEEVMATAARGHSLRARVQQLEAEVPALEKAFLSQTHHLPFFTNGGIDWHPNLRSEQNIITCGDLPRFIMDSYEECRGPPRLFLLDKFDVAGAGACLKRYTDPSFIKLKSAPSHTATVEVHREKKILKAKKKEAQLRNGEACEVLPTHGKLHHLFLEERIEDAHSDAARLVKLRKRQLNGSAVEAKTGKSYMEKFLGTPSPDHKLVCETSRTPLPVKFMSDDTGIKILEVSNISPAKRLLGNESPCSSCKEKEPESKLSSEMDRETNVKVYEQISAGETDEISSNHPKVLDETELAVDEEKKMECSLGGYHSDDVTSEVDNYMDALTTMESELETDNECRPKKSFLNIQNLIDSNGKDEHQWLAQFSDSQSCGDSSASDEISSFKQNRNVELTEVQDRLSDSLSTATSSPSDTSNSFQRDKNEEHMELQTHSSDSQSIGNSSMSDKNGSFKKGGFHFTYSDSFSNVVENIPSEGILLSSTKYFESETEDTPSFQLSETFELQKTDCGQFVIPDDAHVQGEYISDSEQVSCNLCLMTSEHVLLCSDLGPPLPASLPTGAQSDETPSGPVELHLGSEDDKDRMCLVESIAAISDVDAVSQIKDNAFPVDSSDKTSFCLNDCDPYIRSNALLQVSNDLELAHDDECSDHSEVKVFQAKSANENSSEILVITDIGSQGEDDPILPTMEVDSNSGTTLLLDGRDLKADDGIIATLLNGEDLSPVMEIPPVSSFTDVLCSDFTHINPQDERDSTEVEVLNFDQQSNLEEVTRMVHSDELNGSTCSGDPVEDNGHSKHPSSHDCTRQDSLVTVNDMVTEKIKLEDQVVSAVPSVDNAENDACIFTHPSSGFLSSPSNNLSNLHEPFQGFSGSYQREVESYEVELANTTADLDADKRKNQLEPPSDFISSSLIYLTELEESLWTIPNPNEKEMEVNETVATESLIEIEAQKVVDQPELVSADLQSNWNRSVPGDPSDSEICTDIQDSSLKEEILQSYSVNDMNMAPVFSEIDSVQSESIILFQNDLLQNDKDSLSSSPPCGRMESETHSEMLLKSQFDQQDAGFLLKDEENYVCEKQKSQQMQISNHLEQEGISRAASEFAPEFHPDEPSCGSSSQSSAQEINPAVYVMNPLNLKPILPDLFPKATEINLEEMPPLPPLPPMQWRMSKVQHTSLDSQRGENDASQASFQSTQPAKPDDKYQFGVPASEREALMYQNPFLPVMAAQSDQHHHSSELSVGVSEHLVPIPFPIMVNEANVQYNYLVLERSQIQNPFLTLPQVSTGRPPHDYVVASEGEMVLNSSPGPPREPAECAVSGDSPISIQEKLTQSPCQSMEESTLEVKIPLQSSRNLEEEQGDYSISPMSPPNMESVQTNHSQLTSKGEMALSLDSSAQTTEFDAERPSGKPIDKLPHARNPLIDSVAALDKSKLRKVTERVRPKIAPKLDERDSFLEQIRTKSFNLKPAAATRPRIQGPKTNLMVAAILEKANAIRQALAGTGSDEDDDADSWSDS